MLLPGNLLPPPMSKNIGNYFRFDTLISEISLRLKNKASEENSFKRGYYHRNREKGKSKITLDILEITIHRCQPLFGAISKKKLRCQ
jgi:hypothetical protein